MLTRLYISILSIFILINFTFSQNIEIDNSSQTDFFKFIREIPDLTDYNRKKLKNIFGKIFFGQPSSFLSRPISIHYDNNDNLLVLDQGYKTLINYNLKKQAIHRVYSNESSTFIGICKNSSDDILFTDSRNNCVYKINTKTNKVEHLNDSIKLNQPTGIAFSKVTNEIWVVETNSHRISILNNDGGIKKTIGKRGAENGEFNFPTSIWIDDEGKVFVVDAMNFRIQVFDNNGNVILVFGLQGDATGYFFRPKGIATDSKGNIYVAEGMFNAIQVFDKNGKYVYSFGKYGNAIGEFSMPNGIFIDKNDFIYISDYLNSRIQIFKLQNFN